MVIDSPKLDVLLSQSVSLSRAAPDPGQVWPVEWGPDKREHRTVSPALDKKSEWNVSCVPDPVGSLDIID